MTAPLEILVGADVVPDPNSGAAGTVLETNRALAELGHHVHSFWSKDVGRRLAHGNLHNLLELPLMYRRLVQENLRRRRFDVVQLSQPHAYLAGQWLLRQPDRPLMVWRSHGLEAKVDEALARFGELGTSWRRSLPRSIVRRGLARAQRNAMKWCDGAVVPCADDKTFLVNRFDADPERVRVIWHGVPDEYLDAAPNADPSRWNRVLHVSQLSANKAPSVMRSVAETILRRRPDTTMTWVCPESAHDQLTANLPEDVRSRLVLKGWVDRRKLLQELDSHGVFMFPSLAEGAAKAVMEAMARGMCVVASDTSGPRDYIRNGENGILVPVGDSATMADIAIRMLNEPQTCERLGTHARETAAAFRWNRCAGELVDFYEFLNQGRRKEA